MPILLQEVIIKFILYVQLIKRYLMILHTNLQAAYLLSIRFLGYLPEVHIHKGIYFISKLISPWLQNYQSDCLSDSVFVNRFCSINNSTNAAYVWLADYQSSLLSMFCQYWAAGARWGILSICLADLHWHPPYVPFLTPSVTVTLHVM